MDSLQEARELLARDGLCVSGREGVKAHPAVAIERDSHIGFARLVREPDVEPPSNLRSGPPPSEAGR